MSLIKRSLWVMLFVLAGMTGIAAKASAAQQVPWWYCRICHIPEVCYPGQVCSPQGTEAQCYPEVPFCQQ